MPHFYDTVNDQEDRCPIPSQEDAAPTVITLSAGLERMMDDSDNRTTRACRWAACWATPTAHATTSSRWRATARRRGDALRTLVFQETLLMGNGSTARADKAGYTHARYETLRGIIREALSTW